MARLGQRGTQVEIFGAANLLKMEIHVFSKVPNSTSYNWICYKPQPMPKKLSTEILQKIYRLNPPKGYHIEMIHSFENHFDRLAPSDLLLTSMEVAPENSNISSNKDCPIILA